ncbi:hypothetical protein LTS08_006275 [Lithohypha guttulata]|nr:hypothetical protein LTS08_006275 [Lithohypha guttulata]
MAVMDFNALRAQTLRSGADEEAVTVNTRALIDKVLARYSGEWTTLRELIQNAADATATKVTIKFDTVPSPTIPLPQDATPSNMLKHVIQHHTLKRMVVTNNGTPFNENDWTRLKRIAEGNPDETKIGAFGVGFYSVFADCEEPFVSSGREAMAFYWKTNALFTRRLKLPEGEGNTDTNFVLDYRDTTSVIPSLISLSQFLASSLTFVGIEKIELWIDQWNILTLTKKTSPSVDVPIPKDIEPKTSEGFMKVTNVSKELAQIDGEWMPIVAFKSSQPGATRSAARDEAPSLRGFFSRLAGGRQSEDAIIPTKQKETEQTDLTQRVKATIFLNVDTATIKTFTGVKFNEELERATKKPPPKTTKLAVLTAPFVENDTLTNTTKHGDIFGTVLPSRSGRIFIGFPTHQTTGLNAHISAPSVIPTVERESIDLNAKYVRTWNMEMLRAAGIVCRIAWTAEMAELRVRIQNQSNGAKKIRMDHVQPFLQEGITIFKNFTFRESTPSPKTGELLEDAFWRSGKKAAIDVLSSCGVLPTHQVRIAPKDLSFVEGVPVLPEKLMEEAKPFVNKLVDFGLVTEVTVSDIKQALEANALTSKQLTEFLDWLVKNVAKEQLDSQTVATLLSITVANEETEEGSNGRLLILGGIEYFHNPSRIPPNFPVPATVMPLKYTSSFSKQNLESLGWQELQIVPWMRWLIAESKSRSMLREDQDLTSSAAFSSQVFALISKQWESMSQSSKQSLVELLSAHTVVPTKLGMKKPGDAYFPNVKLFDDLPTITGFNNVKDKVLNAFGVRKTVELGVVFDRLLKPTKDVNAQSPGRHMALVQYLASVRDDIPSADMQRLRNTPICPKEDRQSEVRESEQRYKVSELFEPRPQLRDLGLPVLAWQGPYRSNSAEGRLLTSLGLRTTPDAAELISIMAQAGQTGDASLIARAMAFFISGYHANGYAQFDYSKVQTPFLPLENKSDLSTPSNCYIDEGARLLGFDIVRRDLHGHAAMFGVRRHPPIEVCIQILATKRLTSHQEARAIFAYFAGRLNEINASIIPKLQDLNFVPIFSKNREKTIVKSYTSPRNVFLGDSDTFGEIFNYVDFGQEANAFLLKCGSKPEPTKVEVAQILVREPARISSTFKNPEKYLTLLRSLADSVSLLKKNKDLFREMKRAPFLLASKHIPGPKNGNLMGDDEDYLDDDESQGITEWQLCSAEDAIIVDEFISYNLFKSSILAAPQEEGLEDFYFALGSQMLSSLVEEAARHGSRAPDQGPAQKLHRLIIERSQLFLHEQPADNIKHDSRWLEKNLSVQLVSHITLRRSLKGRNITHSEKRTAVITQANREYILWVVGGSPDFYQVSQALIHLLLNRPKLHSPLTLEMLLKTDLLELRNRGFNVSRILRQKAAEARLAENKRQQELEEEQKKIHEQQKAWETSRAVQKKEKEGPQIGAFPDSPDSKNALAGPSQPPESEIFNEPLRSARGMLSNLFGARQQRPGSQALPEPIPQRVRTAQSETDPPPPYSQGGPDQAVTAPHHMRENLLSAIKKSRPHNSSEIFSRGEQNTVSETKSYCDEKPAHELTFVAELKHGIQMFLPQMQGLDPSAFLSQNINGLTRFADLLKSTGDIFSLSPRILNIFYETGGKTIAFNRNGSIFCNYLYFKQLHEMLILGGDAAQAQAGCNDALVYWWVREPHIRRATSEADDASMGYDAFSAVAIAPINVLCVPVGRIKPQNLDSCILSLRKFATIVSVHDDKADQTGGKDVTGLSDQPAKALLFNFSAHSEAQSLRDTQWFEPNRQPQLILGILDGSSFPDSLVSDLMNVAERARVDLKSRAAQFTGKELPSQVVVLNSTIAAVDGDCIALQSTSHNPDTRNLTEWLSSTALIVLTQMLEEVRSQEIVLPVSEKQSSTSDGTNMRQTNKTGNSQRQSIIPTLISNPTQNLVIPEDGAQKSQSTRTIAAALVKLQMGLLREALEQFADGARGAREVDDSAWHAKSLEGILVCMLLLAWSGRSFDIPQDCYPAGRGLSSSSAIHSIAEANRAVSDKFTGNSTHQLQTLTAMLPGLLATITNLYDKMTSGYDSTFPALLTCEAKVRLCELLITVRKHRGLLNDQALNEMIGGPLILASTTALEPATAGLVLQSSSLSNALIEAVNEAQTQLSVQSACTIYLAVCQSLSRLDLERKQGFFLKDILQRLPPMLLAARKAGAVEAGINSSPGAPPSPTSDNRSQQQVALAIRALLHVAARVFGLPSLTDQQQLPNRSDLLANAQKRLSSWLAVFTSGDIATKLEVLRLCVRVSDAVPDVIGSIEFMSLVLFIIRQTLIVSKGLGNAVPLIATEEQARLVSGINNAVTTAQRVGMRSIQADYWDDFLVQGIKLYEHPSAGKLIPHSPQDLSHTTKSGTAKKDPFIYNPFSENRSVSGQLVLVKDCVASFEVLLQNPLELDIEIEEISLLTEGCAFEPQAHGVIVGPLSVEVFTLTGTPKATGSLKVIGCRAKVKNCTERDFAIFGGTWRPPHIVKRKQLSDVQVDLPASTILELKVENRLPQLQITSTSLVQQSLMLLDGEKSTFTITLENTGDTLADLVLFSYQDSVSKQLQDALGTKDLAPADTYELQHQLSSRPAIKRVAQDGPGHNSVFIEAMSKQDFEFEVLGKPGLTEVSILIDYAYLGKPRNEIEGTFYTRQIHFVINVTVNASVDMPRCNVLSMPPNSNIDFNSNSDKDLPPEASHKNEVANEPQCLLQLDLRSIWQTSITATVETCIPNSKDELNDPEWQVATTLTLQPTHTERALVLIPRIYVSDPFAPIPSLDTKRQFVVSASKITLEAELASREAFWYREELCKRLRITWKEEHGKRTGEIDVRKGIRFSARMIDALRVDHVQISFDVKAVQDDDQGAVVRNKASEFEVKRNIFATLVVKVQNLTQEELKLLLRLQPSLHGQPHNVAMDLSKKFVWSGVLQRALRGAIPPGESVEAELGIVLLARSVYEINATVEEVKSARRQATESGLTSDRRIWHARRPCLLRAVD